MEKDIKETKELIVGIGEFSLLLIEKLRDGWDFSDPIAIMMELQKDPKFKEAVKGIHAIPAEAADLSMDEVFELMGIGLNYAQKIMLAVLGK